MTNKIVAIQGNHPSKLKPKTDTSIFLAVEAQKLKLLTIQHLLKIFLKNYTQHLFKNICQIQFLRKI